MVGGNEHYRPQKTDDWFDFQIIFRPLKEQANSQRNYRSKTRLGPEGLQPNISLL
jgi:hypothetical protein